MRKVKFYMDQKIVDVLEEKGMHVPRKPTIHYRVNGVLQKNMENGKIDGSATLLARDERNFEHSKIMSYTAKGMREIRMEKLEEIIEDPDAAKALYSERLKVDVEWDDDERGRLYFSSPEVNKVYEVELIGEEPVGCREVDGIDYGHFNLVKAMVD